MTIKLAASMVVILVAVAWVLDNSPDRSEGQTPDQASEVVASGVDSLVGPTSDAGAIVLVDSLSEDLRDELIASRRDELQEIPASGRPNFVAEPEDPTKVHFTAEPEDPDLVCFVQVAGSVRICDPIWEPRSVAVGYQPSP